MFKGETTRGDELQQPMTYEEAEAIIEEQRFQVLKDLDAKNPAQRQALKEAIFDRVCQTLTMEGNNLPVSDARADNLDPLVMKTFAEWKRYIFTATLEVLGHTTS